MTDEKQEAFLTMLHGLLKLVFDPLFCMCSGILQACYVFFNSSKGPLRFPPWLDPDPPSRSSDDRGLTPTKASGRRQDSIQQIYLSTLFQQLRTKSKDSLESKEPRRQIEER